MGDFVWCGRLTVCVLTVSKKGLLSSSPKTPLLLIVCLFWCLSVCRVSKKQRCLVEKKKERGERSSHSHKICNCMEEKKRGIEHEGMKKGDPMCGRVAFG